MPRLKVFCASSGFHDAVVAAPSKPAALKAWGAKTDLFSMGVAKLVTDPTIAKRALELRWLEVAEMAEQLAR